MQVKCQFCGVKADRETMTCEEKGKVRHYYHPDCWTKELAARQQRAEEVKKLDHLCQLIKHIHDIPAINNKFFPMLQDLRNGTIRFKGPVLNKSKQGVPYEIIEEAYLLAADTIKWSKRNKNFQDDMAELKYGFAIVRNKLSQAVGQYERKQQEEKFREVAKPVTPVNVPEYKPKKNDDKDISDFLE